MFHYFCCCVVVVAAAVVQTWTTCCVECTADVLANGSTGISSESFVLLPVCVSVFLLYVCMHVCMYECVCMGVYV